MTQTNQNEPELLAKLSLKGMGAQPKARSLKEGDKFAIAAIYGSASRHDVATSTFGDSVRFMGDFEGVTIATGQRYRSGKAFLPGIVEDILADAINGLDESKGQTSVEFAFEIGVEYSEKGNMGYQYTVKPLVKLAQSDALAHLRETVGNALKALPAPEPQEKGKPGRKPSK